MKTLLIVESPAKSKTIEKLLGPNYIVLSSFGHIRNLDKKGLGVDVENGFKPDYRILTDRSKQIRAIQETIKEKGVDKVLLASDEDREGEAIAWHCAVVFKLNIEDKNRICFHEITKSALQNAVANPRKIDMAMVFSQQARRILDRLVGFKLSPLLWKHIAPKLSAGRVQSVALKLLIDQEIEIEKFMEKKFYKTIGEFNNKLKGTLNKELESDENINKFLEHCKNAIFIIKNIDTKRNEKRPPPPYITSSIQQDCCARFGIGSKKVMSVLQKLYENGYITYHRTDNTNLSKDIQEEIKKYILDKFGSKYLHPRIYNSKIKCAQEAHEAIRPTNILTENLDSNENLDGIDKKIYSIIWKRTMASQMSAYVYDIYTISISISEIEELFISKCEKSIFDGYKKIYDEVIKKEDEDDNDENINNGNDFDLESIKIGNVLKYTKISCMEKYKNPPLRYDESKIIRKMEKIGIGRPSTYSSIIETVIDRKYAEKKDVNGKKVEVKHNILEKNIIKVKVEDIFIGKEKKKLVPTDLGKSTIAFLEKHFSEILDCNFTSQLEQNLDNVANNNLAWNIVVGEFYNKFEPNIEKLNDKSLIAQSKDERKRFIGKLEESGEDVYSYIGKYGPLLQIGIDGTKNMKFIKLDTEYSINTVTMEDVKVIMKFPRNIGSYKGKDIIMKKGMYGIYLSYDGQNYKLLENMDENIGLEDCIKCIDVKNGKTSNGGNIEKNSENTNDNKSNIILNLGKYIVKNGPYGPYIHYDKKFYKIGKNYNPSELTIELCEKIIKEPKKDYKKKDSKIEKDNKIEKVNKAEKDIPKRKYTKKEK
jgi:DNA topoisomerase-1